MTNDALINGKVVTLTEEEKIAGEKFHRSRVPFAWIDKKLVFNDNAGDDRDHQHWLLEDFGISVEEFETMNRGYMIESRIQLFKGSKFEPINMDDVSVTDFSSLTHKHREIFNSTEVTICNGVHVGKVGEIWEPIFTLGNFATI